MLKSENHAAEVAQAVGIPLRTLRFWADYGVVRPSVLRYSSGSKRFYSYADAAKVSLAHDLASVGLSLKAVGNVLEKVEFPETWTSDHSLCFVWTGGVASFLPLAKVKPQAEGAMILIPLKGVLARIEK